MCIIVKNLPAIFAYQNTQGKTINDDIDWLKIIKDQSHAFRHANAAVSLVASINPTPLIDREARGGIAGNDVRIIAKNGRSVDI